MINLADFNFNKVHLLKYIDDINKEDIPLVDIVKINVSLYMNYDNIMMKYYGKDGEQYLKLILMFNNLNDISEINIGDYLRIPDLNSLVNSMEMISDSVNGIMDFNEFNLVKNESKDVKKQSKDKRKTTANPRLNITLKKPDFKDSKIIY